MKKLYYLLIIVLISLLGCKDTSLYSYQRPYFATSFKTLNQRELKSAAYKDTLFVQDGQGILSAYFAIIKGEFSHVMDSIVQYGHCWSFTSENPIIDPDDTTMFTRYYNWTYDSLGSFTSYIPLYPESPFYVRSYVITVQGDTGYNPQVYLDTALPPINEWSIAHHFASSTDDREGACVFSVKYKGETKVFLSCGNNGNKTYQDLWEYNVENDTWTILSSNNISPSRTEAVGFAIVTLDNYGREDLKIYIGTGTDISGTERYQDFWEYSYAKNTWKRTTDYPIPVKSAVSFSIGDKGFVGTGTSFVNVSSFYMYDYKRKEEGKNPWVVMPNITNERSEACSFVVDGIGFVGLGLVSEKDASYLSDFWLFRPPDNYGNSGTWTKISDFPGIPRAQSVGFSVDHQGYAGLGFNGVAYFRDLYRYDPYTDKWYKIKDYKLGPDYQGQIQDVTNAVGFGVDKKGYVGTGFQSDSVYTKEMWIYRPW